MPQNYEMLVDALIGVLSVLYDVQAAPNDGVMSIVRDMCDACGYEQPITQRSAS